ncbi:MAG TPA: hypothetical protein VIU36_07015 [Gammaproteobacteria bacterium]
MDSHNTNGALDYGLANERWLTIYKYYLMVAVAFSVMRPIIWSLMAINSDRVSVSWINLVWSVAQTGLFVFALWSIRRIGEKWVRTLQLWINGVAVIMAIITFIQPYSYNILINVGRLFMFPIASVGSWYFPFAFKVQSIATLLFATYFFFRWLKLARPTPVMATDSQGKPLPAAEQQIDPWRKHRIWAGILTVLLGLLLGLIGLAFAQQMAFLSGVMSGGASSGISIPLPVVAILLGIIIGGLMFCGEQGRGRPMVWLAAVTAPLLTLSVSYSPVFILIVLAISIYLIWVLRETKPAKESE